MAEQFETRDLIFCLCLKGTAGKLVQTVEVNLRARDGNWHQIEMPLTEFHRLVYKQMFPEVARRMQTTGSLSKNR